MPIELLQSFTTAFANYSSTRKQELGSRGVIMVIGIVVKNGILLLDAGQKWLVC